MDTRRKRLAIAATSVAVVASTLIAVIATERGRGAPARTTNPAAAGDLTPAPEPTAAPPATSGNGNGDFTVAVDPSVIPSRPDIPGFADGDPPRPVGRLRTGDGATSDVVRDEVIVTADEAGLAGFLARWGGTVLDTWPADPGEPADHLVRIDPARAPDGDVAADLLAIEPHEGELLVDDDATLRLLRIAAAEGARHGTAVHLNVLEHADAIADGHIQEAPDRNNPFDWSWVDSARPQQIGLDVAWQLLDAHAKLDERSVLVMVNDGGFSHNPDFPPPEASTLRSAKWGDKNRMDCGDNECPYHGSDVVLALMGQHDNGYGTAGPAGPVAELVAVAVYEDKWKRLRKLEEMVDEHRPDIVNMSYSSTITAFRAASEDAANKRYGRMVRDGALLVAAAGNQHRDVDTRTCVGSSCSENRLIIPCESKHVMCVGGLAGDANVVKTPTATSKGSNYGQHDSATSVEIYGPWNSVSIADHENTYGTLATRSVGGTSFASPFVAGVAALVKAADPSLGPEEIRQLLLDTANLGVGGTWITGSQRRINAAAAVARALNVPITDPVVRIDHPTHGESYLQVSWLQLKGTATDFRGAPLPITWTSDVDGDLSGGPKLGVVSLGQLSLGTHTITARAEDVRGVVATAQITIDVVEQAPELTILSPADGAVVYDDEPVTLLGDSSDPDDFWQPLPNGKVRWEVRVKGQDQVVFADTGHQATIPKGTLSPGDYTVTFRSDDGGAEGRDEVHVTVEPAGSNAAPRPKILAPQQGLELSTGTGMTVAVELKGRATDAEDGTLDGTALAWIARNGDDVVVVCAGTAFPSFDNDDTDDGEPDEELGLSAGPVDCSTATAHLGPSLHPWVIELHAVDRAGRTAQAEVAVAVHLAVG